MNNVFLKHIFHSYQKIRVSDDGVQICAYFRSSLSNSNVFPSVRAPAISNGEPKWIKQTKDIIKSVLEIKSYHS